MDATITRRFVNELTFVGGSPIVFELFGGFEQIIGV